MLPVQKSCTINCTEEYDFLIRCLTFLLKTKNQSTWEIPNANKSKSNENRNKSRRDHDITMAGALNNQLP